LLQLGGSVGRNKSTAKNMRGGNSTNRSTPSPTPKPVDNLVVQPLLSGIREGLVDMIHLQGRFADRCNPGQTLNLFQLADRHLRNLSYVGGHLVASGADIVGELAEAVDAYHRKSFGRFGEAIGRAWHKVLLSDVRQVPAPGKTKAIKETSFGLIEGFFDPSFIVELIGEGEDEQKGSSKEESKPMNIDLKKCMQDDNMRFFAEVWEATWLLFTQFSGQLNQTVGDDRWERLLAVAFVDMPDAMMKCGVKKNQAKALVDALKSLEGLDFVMDMTSKQVRTAEASVDLSQAIADFSKKRWHDFGADIGRLLRELVLFGADVGKQKQEEARRSIERGRLAENSGLYELAGHSVDTGGHGLGRAPLIFATLPVALFGMLLAATALYRSFILRSGFPGVATAHHNARSRTSEGDPWRLRHRDSQQSEDSEEEARYPASASDWDQALE